MKNIITIPIYKLIDEKFTLVDKIEYEITYLSGPKMHQLRIVVNGCLTKQTINILNPNVSCRKAILTAISEFKNDLIDKKNKVIKPLTRANLTNIYAKHIIHKLAGHLFKVAKCDSRDELTKYNLIHEPITNS